MSNNSGPKLKRQIYKNESLYLIPLIDILLVTIFFLMNSTFTESSTFSVSIPQAVSGEASVKQSLIVTISKDNTLLINEKPVTQDSFVTVFNSIKSSFQENPSTVFLVADKDTPYEILIQIMDKIRLTGMENISLVTRKSEL